MTNILIAEDESRIAAFIEKGLQKEGYKTQVVSDGAQALKLALTHKYDLLLLDLGLPGLDGLSVLNEIRTRSAHPPVIVVTAIEGTEERDYGLSLGADEYVTKPFRFNDLLRHVLRHI